MKNNYYESPKASRLMHFFWKAAGGDQYLLERSTYSDQVKYFCLGGIVIATGVLAGLAGGYALYTIFEPRTEEINQPVDPGALGIAIVFGIIWGLIIFNIDRFIVTSTGKGDGTEAITKQELKSAIPRIIMGLVIALTISKPIEIRMFQKEIDAELQTEKEEYIKDNTILVQAKYDKNFLNDLNQKKQEVRALESNLRTDIKNKEAQMNEEEKKCPPGSNSLCRGPQWYKLEKEKDQLQAQLPFVQQDMSSQLSEIDKNIESILSKRNKELKNIEVKANNMGGLARKIELAHRVAGFWISLFITLLFVVIELTPIFFKMMLIKGPYDYLDENVKELAKAESGIEVVYDFYQDKQGMERHKIINHSAEMKRAEKRAMLKAQEELNEHLIQEWKKKKLKEISENPDKFME
jgi:hypothetical protein